MSSEMKGMEMGTGRHGRRRAGRAGAGLVTLAALAGLGAAACAPADAGDEAAGDGAVDLAAVDGVFSRFDRDDGPGCAVAVSRDGQTTLTRAYGMSNLEYDIPNTPETVFEPGSVSKQFTAAAAILLALDGEISLDDDIRDYFPELPDYGETISVRNLIHHTSGLRDWGSIADVGGWGRTTRLHTHMHVLDIASRQRSLNYPPGEYYSYTNTGYNLLAMLVERVSGKTFDEFSQERIFGPLGMTSTQWRDDFNEVVKDRAVGYVPAGEDDDEWRMLMPFENVHGNGGLLTTVGDLLKFTRNLETGEVGGPRFIEEMHRQGVLDSGQRIAYAGGLFVGEHRGVREVQHSGGTAAYRGFLTRFPDHGLAVSVMCNAANVNPGGLAHDVAELYLEDAFVEADAPEGVEVSDERLESLAGAFRDVRHHAFVEIEAADGGLSAFGTRFTPVSETRFEAPNGLALVFGEDVDHGPSATLETPSQPVRLLAVERYTPTAAELTQYEGEYTSDEAEVTYTVEVGDEGLRVVDRYGQPMPLEPTYRDAFELGSNAIVFRRDGAGRVNAFSVGRGRVWDLRFERVG